MLFWNLGLVDTFSVLKLCINCGSQYMSIVGTADVGNSSDLGVKTLLEPVFGLGTSYQFVKAAATAAERRQRIATLASFLAASASSVTTDPNTNIAIGAAIGNKIGYMKAILARSGSSQHILNPSLKEFTIVADSVKTPVLDIHPYRTQFTYNSKMIINNMFQEHTARRYLQGSTQKIKTVAPIYLAPIASTQINSTVLIAWTCLGVGIIVCTTFGISYLFQRANRKRWQNQQNQNDEVLIDGTAYLSE